MDVGGDNWPQNCAISGKDSDSGMESRPVDSNPYSSYFFSMVLGLKIPIIFIVPQTIVSILVSKPVSISPSLVILSKQIVS